MAELLGICVFTGIGPMAVYTFIIWWIDHWEREPLPLVMAAFFWGAIPAVLLAIASSTIVASAMSVQLAYSPVETMWYACVITAPITEEIAKGLALLGVFLFFRRELDSLLDGILYGAVVGFGFAGVENVFYFLGAQDAIDLSALIVLRGVVFGLNHAFFTSLTGIGFAVARFSDKRPVQFAAPLCALTLAILCHGAHNYMVTAGLHGIVYSLLLHWSGVFWIFVIVVWSLVNQGRLIREHLQEEVATKVITQQQANHAGSVWSRWKYGFWLFGGHITKRQGRRRLDQLSAKLALKKYQIARVPHDEDSHREVYELRREIGALSKQLAV